MTTTIAKLFMFARSQAVRLPNSLRFDIEEVVARRFGRGVMLLPVNAPWRLMQETLEEFEPGFQMERDQPEQQMREDWPSCAARGRRCVRYAALLVGHQHLR